MADKPRFSPNDTYVLDNTVIQKTDKLRLTGILRELDRYARKGKDASEETDDADEQRADPEFDPLSD